MKRIFQYENKMRMEMKIMLLMKFLNLLFWWGDVRIPQVGPESRFRSAFTTKYSIFYISDFVGFLINTSYVDENHGLRTPREEIAFTALSATSAQFFRYL